MGHLIDSESESDSAQVLSLDYTADVGQSLVSDGRCEPAAENRKDDPTVDPSQKLRCSVQGCTGM